MPVRSHRSAARLLVAPLRRWPWTLGVLALAVVALFVASVALREPVRQHVEQRMNAALDGYTVSLGGLTLRPFAVGLDLREVVVVQDPNPEPPVAQIGRLRAALQWRALLRLALVADLELARPTVYVDRRHALTETGDEVAVQDRGWAEALEAIHPLRINQFRVTDGHLTYVDEGPFRPLVLSQVNVVARNIRKVHSGQAPYPSPLHAEMVVFDFMGDGPTAAALPLFGDVQVYDPEQARERGLLQRAWERVLDVLVSILENVPRDEVATVVDVSGPLEDPALNTWQALGNLLRNAFLQAILPGFERPPGRA
jgi:hypothetical protein